MSELYSKIRSDIRTGDLLAWKTTKITSFFSLVLFLYQKILKAKYTHVAIALRLGDRVFIVEATPSMTQMVPLSGCDEFYLLKAGVVENDKVINTLLRDITKPYGLLDLFKAMVGIKGSRDDLYCSELVNNFYSDIGYISEDLNIGFTPDTAVKYMTTRLNTEPTHVKVDTGAFDGV